VDRNTETVILRFFDRTGVILETPELFTKAYFTHKPECAYLLAPVHKLLDYARTLRFGPILLLGDGRIWGIFPPLLRFCIKANGLALFLLHLRTAFFDAQLLGPQKKWQVCSLKNYKVLMETPYTIVTP